MGIRDTFGWDTLARVAVAAFVAMVWKATPAAACGNLPATGAISGPAQIGAGLEDAYTIALSSPCDVCGAQVTLTVDNPTFCLLSLRDTDPGQQTIAVPVLRYQRSAGFFVHAIAGRSGQSCVVRGGGAPPPAIGP